MKHIVSLFIACALLCAPVAAQEKPATDAQKRPPRPDRVYLKDLEGTWVSESFMKALKASRSPRQAARQAPPIVIQMKKDNGVYPIVTTNFRSAVLNFVIEVEPDRKPRSWRLVTAKSEGIINSSDVTYVYFTGKRASSGKFESLSIKEPHFAKRKRVDLAGLSEPLETFINRHTLAGKYKDERGGVYEFTEAGDATLPDRKFAYEILLDTSKSGCDVLLNHHERAPDKKEAVGFAAKGDKVLLYKAAATSKGAWQCDAQPTATLTRDSAT